MDLYFVRHAESLKSVEGRHGGQGLPLTDQGRRDVSDLVKFCRDSEHLDLGQVRMFCSVRIQAQETCIAIAEETGARWEAREELSNIHLGVLDGLSNEEARKRYPEAAESLEAWRRGRQAIQFVRIPGAEEMSSFYRRIATFVSMVASSPVPAVLVATRSVGVAVTNAVVSRSSEMIEDEYVRYCFDPCSLSKLSVGEQPASIVYLNRTDFLDVSPQFPDD